MLMRSLISFMILLFVPESPAQKFLNLKTFHVDSLLSVLPGQIAEDRVNTLNRLAVSIHFVDTSQAMYYAREAMSGSKQMNYDKGMADAFRNYGHIFHFRSNYPKALQNYYKALSIYERMNDKYLVMWVNYDIATTHFYANNHDMVLRFEKPILNLYHELRRDGHKEVDVHDFVNMLSGTALTYSLLGNNTESLKRRLEILELMIKNQFPKIEILMATWTIGVDYVELGKPDSAIVYLQKALNFPDENQNITAQKYRALMWLGELYFFSGKTDTALACMQKSYNWYNQMGFIYWALYASNGLGRIYYEINDLVNAEKQYSESKRLFTEVFNRKSLYRSDSLKYVISYGLELYRPLPQRAMKEMVWSSGVWMYYSLYEICEKQNRPDKALKYHVAYAHAMDTLNHLRRTSEIIELQTRYETEKKEQQIISLTDENAFQELKLRQSRGYLFGLGGLVVLVSLFAIIFIRQNKLKNEQQNLLLQQRLFRSQMNPHFIFNSLTSIQNFILEEDSDKASKYLSRFSKLVRSILESSTEEYVTLKEEIQTIENYLELQKIRFQDKFDYTIQVDKTIQPENIIIPPMLAQPFIENSIEHGIKHKRTKGNIFIRFTLKNSAIVLEVEDDGVGREKAREILYKQNKEHKSLATAITMERIRVLNKKLKQKIKLQILDLKDSTNVPLGTKVQFEIPWIA